MVIVIYLKQNLKSKQIYLYFVWNVKRLADILNVNMNPGLIYHLQSTLYARTITFIFWI